VAFSVSGNRHVRIAVLTPLLVVAAAFVFGSAQLRTGAQTGTPPAAGQGFVGAWRLTFETPLGPSQSLLTLMADGTLLFSGQPVKPASGAIPVTFISAAHGAWQPTGSTTAAATWVGFVSDGHGKLLATATDSVEASLGADGDRWSGAYSATVADPDGNVLFVGDGTVRATRITLQPLATPPPGTPVVALE
jgi:hypothetical protein